jgi:serine protease
VNQSFSYANTGAGVNVYILDSGIRATHQDFGGRVIRAYTAVSDGYGTGDCDGHGTHVAGIVGGKKYGVAKEVRLHAVRVLGCAGTGSLSGIIAGVDWVTNNRVLPAVANMSLGTSSSAALNTAVQNSIRSGVVYTIAAGNSGTDACSVSPANTAEALTVGATWNGDGLPGYSNHGSCLDILAPGSAIRSDAIIDDTSSVIKGGTSMAAPHVAGVAALYLAANRSATPAQVARAVVTGATPNVLSGLPAGTPNLLLFSGVGSASSGPVQATPGSPLPSDTTVAPPIGSQLVDNPPVPSFTWSCARARCTFDASGSTDDRGITDFSWSFGGGGTIITNKSSKTSYTYGLAGTYTVTLTVTDTSGQRRSTSAVVTVKRV